MGRLPVTFAVGLIKDIREKFGVEIKTHNPCGLKGFYMTIEEPDKKITDYVIDYFNKAGAVVDIDENETTFVYKYYKDPVESKFSTTLDNARLEREQRVSKTVL